MLDYRTLLENTIFWHFASVAHGDADGIVESRYQLQKLGWHVAERDGKLRERNSVLPLPDPFTWLVDAMLSLVAAHEDGNHDDETSFIVMLGLVGWTVKPVETPVEIDPIGMRFHRLDTDSGELTVVPFGVEDIADAGGR